MMILSRRPPRAAISSAARCRCLSWLALPGPPADVRLPPRCPPVAVPPSPAPRDRLRFVFRPSAAREAAPLDAFRPPRRVSRRRRLAPDRCARTLAEGSAGPTRNVGPAGTARGRCTTDQERTRISSSPALSIGSLARRRARSACMETASRRRSARREGFILTRSVDRLARPQTASQRLHGDRLAQTLGSGACEISSSPALSIGSLARRRARSACTETASRRRSAQRV